MSSADDHGRLATRFTDTVAAVPSDRWDAPSPCDDWTARDVLRHVVDLHTGVGDDATEQERVLAFLGRSA